MRTIKIMSGDKFATKLRYYRTSAERGSLVVIKRILAWGKEVDAQTVLISKSGITIPTGLPDISVTTDG